HTGGQLDDERRTATAAGAARLHANVAAVLFHDAQADREAESGAFALGFGAEERLEHALGDILRNARTVVRNVDGQAVGLALRDDLDASAAARLAHTGDRLGRV